MPITAAQFRIDFPEFADTAKFPDGAVNFWLGWGPKFLDACRWGDLFDIGLEYFVAFHLVVDQTNRAAAAAGQPPGAIEGPLTQQAVDKVSFSMEAAKVTMDGAGYWNANSYGIQFWQFSRMIGAGPVQVGAGGTPPYPIQSWW